MPQQIMSAKFTEWSSPFQKAGFQISCTELMISPLQQKVSKSDSLVPCVSFAHWYLVPSKYVRVPTHHVSIGPVGIAVVIDDMAVDLFTRFYCIEVRSQQLRFDARR